MIVRLPETVRSKDKISATPLLVPPLLAMIRLPIVLLLPCGKDSKSEQSAFGSWAIVRESAFIFWFSVSQPVPVMMQCPVLFVPVQVSRGVPHAAFAREKNPLKIALTKNI